WRSYAAGQAPFVQVGSGILEGSPAAPPDAFAALWRFDVQDVAASAWPFTAPGSAQGTSALFFDGDLALDVQVEAKLQLGVGSTPQFSAVRGTGFFTVSSGADPTVSLFGLDTNADLQIDTDIHHGLVTGLTETRWLLATNTADLADLRIAVYREGGSCAPASPP